MAGLDPAILFGGDEKDARIKSGQGEMWECRSTQILFPEKLDP
jgi:hypothetical protein